MKKKTFGRIAAASLAAMTAVSAMSVTTSALEIGNNNTTVSGYLYPLTITTSGSGSIGGMPTPGTSVTYYYTTDAMRDTAISKLTENQTSSKGTAIDVTTRYNNGSTVYVGTDGKVSNVSSEVVGGTSFTVRGTSSVNPGYPSYGYSYQYASSSNNVYLGGDGYWYPNVSSLRSAGTTLVQTVKVPAGQTYADRKSQSVTGYVYFDRTNGTYVSDIPTDTSRYIQILGSTSSYDDYWYDDDYYRGDYGTYDVYKVNGRYYPTLSSALSAADGSYARITKIYDYSKPQTNYFSHTTGRYYRTYSEALRASGNSSSNVYTFSYYSSNYYDDLYGYDNVDYYYWLLRQGNSDSTSSSKNNDTTTASVGNRKGWTAVSKYLSSLRSGSSVSVSMNTETSIPSSVTSALKGKNVTAKFVLSNGVVFTINGKDISTTSSIDIDTAYNTNMVPTKLVKAAYKKNKAVSNAQITISGGSFGAEADVTVKFATKRAGCTAKLYRYNPSKETLSLVDTAKVQSNGKCTFGDVDKGGNFVIILC